MKPVACLSEAGPAHVCPGSQASSAIYVQRAALQALILELLLPTPADPSLP